MTLVVYLRIAHGLRHHVRLQASQRSNHLDLVAAAKEEDRARCKLRLAT